MTDEAEVQVPENEACEMGKRCGCRGCMWVAAGLLLLLVGVALLLPARCTAREAARRMQCGNNLKQIMLGMHYYQNKYGCFPPAYTVDQQGQPMHSWRVLLLEFLDEDLYNKYDFNRPWNSPGNLAVAKMMKRNGPYRCPSEGCDSDGQPPNYYNTCYVMLVGPQAFSEGPTGRKPEEIIDGSANTFAIVEMSPSGIGWTEPRDLNVSEMSFKLNDPDRPCIRSCHAYGANVGFVDGCMRYLGDSSADEKTLKALITVNGNDDVSKLEPW